MIRKKYGCLLFFSMVICCWFLLTTPVYAEGLFEISAETEQSTIVPNGADSYPVQITITNNGNDFMGTLVLSSSINDGEDKTIAHGIAIDIAAGETQVLTLPIQNQAHYVDTHCLVRIDIADEDDINVAQQIIEITLKGTGYDGLFAGILGDNKTIEEAVEKAKVQNADYEVSTRAEVLTTAFIEINKLSGWHFLVVDELTDQNVWPIIDQWIKSGGCAMIEKSVYDTYIDKTLKTENYMTYGLGGIYVYSQIDWKPENINLILTHFFSDEKLNTMNNSDEIMSSAVANYELNQKAPSFMKYLLLLVLAILIIGPCCFLVLKRKDCLTGLWIAVPVLAVILSIVVYCAGKDTRYTEPFIQYGSRIWLTADGSITKTYIRLTDPQIGQVVFSMPQAVDLKPNTGSADYIYENDTKNDKKVLLQKSKYTVSTVNENEQTYIVANSERVFSASQYMSTTVGENLGDLRADLSCTNGVYSGTVTNQTKWALQNVFLIHQGIFVMLGNIDAGETLQIDSVAPVSMVYGGISFDFAKTSVADYTALDWNTSAVNNIMRAMLESMNTDNFKTATFIGGYTVDNPPDINSSQVMSLSGLSLVLENVDIQENNNTRFTEAAIYGVGHTEEDIELFSSVYYDIYTSDTAIYLDYQLKEGYAPDYIGRLPDESDEGMEIALYNQATGAWDVVFADGSDISGDVVSDYIDASHVIQMKVMPTDEMGYIPVLTVTGEMDK